MLAGSCTLIILSETGRWEWSFKVKDRRSTETINGKKHVTWPRKLGAASAGRSVRQQSDGTVRNPWANYITNS